MIQLFPERYIQIVIRSLKEAQREMGHRLGIVKLAAENIYVRRVGQIRKMTRNQRSLDELHHGVAGNPLILAEIDDLGIPETPHFDEIAELDNITLNHVRAADYLGIAVVDVHARVEAPGPNLLVRITLPIFRLFSNACIFNLLHHGNTTDSAIFRQNASFESEG